MADPFSVAAAVVGVLDVTARVTKFLWRIFDEAGRIDDDLQALRTEIESLDAVVRSVGEKHDEELHQNPIPATNSSSPYGASSLSPTLIGSPTSTTPSATAANRSPTLPSRPLSPSERQNYPAVINTSPLSPRSGPRSDSLWLNVNNILGDCRTLIEEFEDILAQVVGGKNAKVAGKWEGLKKTLRRQSKDVEFEKRREKLGNYMNALNLALTSINMTQVLKMRNSNDQAFEQLAVDVQDLGLQLKAQIASLQPQGNVPAGHNLYASLNSAKALIALSALNEHFPTDQAVSSEYTGRENVMRTLEKALMEHLKMQKRFVIWGLPGSGKTEIAIKFCQDFRENFWGIFWVDGSNDEVAMQSFGKIAELGGVFSQAQSTEMNFQSGKAWLTQRQLPWLLIIDSADGIDMDIRRYFPAGERGFILITTRNQAASYLGTAGEKYIHLDVLDETDATDLLLKSALLVKPNPATRSLAVTVSHFLGLLPLAIVHAGAAIRNAYCTLERYKDSFERAWKRVSSSRKQSTSYTDDEKTLSIYKSYELIYQSLESRNDERSRRAIELLKMFAFFHPAHIRVDILEKAVENSQLDKEAREKDAVTKQASRSCTQSIQEAGKMAVLYFKLDRGPPVLPSFIRHGKFEETWFHDSLATLISTSLITRATGKALGTPSGFGGNAGAISMHSLVHKWVRDRPAMGLIEQAVWCEAAANALGQTIVLPPLGYSKAEEAFRRELLPHVDCVRQYQKDISKTYEHNKKQNWKTKILPYARPRLSFAQAGRLARFSRIYMESGRWQDAKELQSEALIFFVDMLGVGHPISLRLMLALSFTNFGLGESSEAADLQQAVMDARVDSLGVEKAQKDVQYLEALDRLGTSRWSQGRMKEAIKHHQDAYNGMVASKEVGPHAKATYIAKDHIGRVHSKYFRFSEAKDCHLDAVSGLRDLPEAQDDDCLQEARDNLAVCYVELKTDLKKAHEMIVEVVKVRTKRLGPEHPFTLWSKLNLARATSALGNHAEAEDILNKGLGVVEKTLGTTHIGYFMGKVRLAEVKYKTGRHEEADEMLQEVCRSLRNVPSTTNGEHPDRIGALLLRVDNFKLQKRYDDAMPMFDELRVSLNKLGGHDHPLHEMIRKEKKYLEDLKNRKTGRPETYQASL